MDNVFTQEDNKNIQVIRQNLERIMTGGSAGSQSFYNML